MYNNYVFKHFKRKDKTGFILIRDYVNRFSRRWPLLEHIKAKHFLTVMVRPQDFRGHF